MTPYEFGSQLSALDKEAAVNLQGFMNSAARGLRGAAANVRRAIPAATRRQVRNVAGNAAKRVAAGGQYVDDLTGGRLSWAGQQAQNKAVGAGRFVGGVGQLTQDAARHGLNYADDFARGVMNMPRGAVGTRSNVRLGNAMQGRLNRVSRQLPFSGGEAATKNPLNPLNLAIGGGTLYGGARAMGLTGGGGEPTQENIDSQAMNTQLAQHQFGEAGHDNNNNGLMGMWNSLPIEARYAIGAGVPLALAGAFMGGRGNYGMGGAMGALGLGAAGLGAAGAGMFGDGARRMVGQGANALYGMIGGQGGGPMDQINALSRLSPEFGTTMLMGRDPNMSSEQGRQMYDFLTHNRNIIEQLLPQLQNASVNGVKQSAALEFGVKIARCWKGYEPVPGKKPFTDGSCRPAGSKKKKEKKAVSSASRGKTEMNCAPSSRGSTKLIDDKQRGTNSPVPTDATNNKQPNEKVSAVPFKKMELVPDDLPKKPAKKKPPVNKNETEKDAAINLGGIVRGVGSGIASGARGLVGNAGKLTQRVGNFAGNQGRALASGGAKMMQRGLNQTGARGAFNTAVGATGAAAGAGLNVAGRAAARAGRALRAGGDYTAAAVPLAGLGLYGAHQATKGYTQPYTSAAYEYGANMANNAGQGAMNAARTVGQGFQNTGAAIGDAVGTGYGTARNAVVNTARDVRRGVNTAVQTAAQVPQVIGQGIHDTSAAIGDAVGTGYGTARNAVTNAAQTARKYVPSVRNPFYYE